MLSTLLLFLVTEERKQIKRIFQQRNVISITYICERKKEIEKENLKKKKKKVREQPSTSRNALALGA